jgi:hypothetical protein
VRRCCRELAALVRSSFKRVVKVKAAHVHELRTSTEDYERLRGIEFLTLVGTISLCSEGRITNE